MRNATLKTKLTILVVLGILVFASASEAVSRRFATADPDLIFCKPQRSTSANLWTCYDYYDNEFKNLIITEQPKNAERTNKAP